MMTEQLLIYELQSRKLDGSGWVVEWAAFVAFGDVRAFINWVEASNPLYAIKPDEFRIRRSTELPDYTFDPEIGLRRVGHED